MATDTPALDELCAELTALRAARHAAMDDGSTEEFQEAHARYAAALIRSFPALIAERTALREEVMHLAAAVNGESCACSGCKPR